MKKFYKLKYSIQLNFLIKSDIYKIYYYFIKITKLFFNKSV